MFEILHMAAGNGKKKPLSVGNVGFRLDSMAVAPYGDNIHLVGGSRDSVLHGGMYLYHPDLGTVTDTGKTMPEAKTNAASCVVGDFLYVFGGIGSNGWSKTTHSYNLKTGAWRRLTDAPRNVGVGSLVEYGTFLYALNVTGNVADRIVRYNISTGSWSYAANIPTRTVRSQAVLWGNKIYVVGGYDYTTSNRPGELWCFDTVNNTWSKLSSMPKGVSEHTLTAYAGKLYVQGGYDGTNRVDLLQVYDIATDTWGYGEAFGGMVTGAGSALIDAQWFVIAGVGQDTQGNQNRVYCRQLP